MSARNNKVVQEGADDDGCFGVLGALSSSVKDGHLFLSMFVKF